MTTDQGSPFADRTSAGEQLAQHPLLQGIDSPIVIALPRGGVPVGFAVAQALNAPLEVLIVRKIGVPWQPELGIGAIAEEDIEVLDQEMVRRLGLTATEIETVRAKERNELIRRVKQYREGKVLRSLVGTRVVLVDDGIATGGTVLAAISFLRKRGVRRIIIATPICAAATARALRTMSDQVIALVEPEALSSVGDWYLDFCATEDEEVLALLARATADPSPNKGLSS